MIQDIAPHIYHNEYKPSAPDKDSFILTYENGRILLPRQNREEAITFPRFQELEGRLDNLYVNYIYLFSIDDQRFYLIPHLDTVLLPDYELHIRNIWHLQELQDINCSSGTAIVSIVAVAENQ